MHHDVIFIVNGLIDMRRRIINLLLKYAETTAFLNNETDKISLIKQYIDQQEITVTDDAINRLNFNLDGNLQLIISEIDKLSLANSIIDDNVIINYSFKTVTHNIFDLANLIINEKPQLAYANAKLLITDGNSIFNLNNLLFKQFKFMLLVKNLVDEKKSNDEIAFLLKTNVFRVQHVVTDIQNINASVIKAKILFLIDNDYTVKTGHLNDDIALSLLILKNNN